MFHAYMKLCAYVMIALVNSTAIVSVFGEFGLVLSEFGVFRMIRMVMIPMRGAAVIPSGFDTMVLGVPLVVKWMAICSGRCVHRRSPTSVELSRRV